MGKTSQNRSKRAKKGHAQKPCKMHEFTMKTTLITDGQSLESATINGRPLKVYDDSWGPLWIHRDSMGVTGIVRAQSWEDAYSIFEDEFFPAADEEAFGPLWGGSLTPHEQACWDEAYGYRGNGRKEEDGSISSIYAKDLNGDWLEPLTPQMLGDWNIKLEVKDEGVYVPPTLYFLWHLSRRPIRGRAFVASWSGRYGASSSVAAGYKGRRMVLEDPYSGCDESPFNPEGHMPSVN